MQFNTWEFLWFSIGMLVLYWLFYKKPGIQHLILLLGSYYFYSRLHLSFPLYLFVLTAVSYFFARAIEQSNRQKKTILVTGLVLLSSCLLILKYANFGIANLNNWGAEFSLLKLLVPVGLSFYTFSSIGYLTDVYRKRIPAERNPITYGAYISFFPHLLAGPIPTATGILPQFQQKRVFDMANLEPALQQIIWGLFKKMVIADNISLAVNYCFTHTDSLNSLSLYLGIVLFSCQIYADFSAYSEIARGVAKLFGIHLIANFKSPFLSRNPGEFWRRWHTSLTRWLTDYLYIPLGGRNARGGKYILIVLFIFLFSGLWHGANWTFVLWGLLNGLYLLPYIFTNSLVRHTEAPNAGRILPDWRTLLQILLTFHMITFSRILFKSEDLAQAGSYALGLATQHRAEMPPVFLLQHLHWCLLLIVLEWVQRFRTHPLDSRIPVALRYLMYVVIIALTITYHKPLSLQEYYYFRF